MAIRENPTHLGYKFEKELSVKWTKDWLKDLKIEMEMERKIKIAQEKMDILMRNNDKIDGLSPDNKELIKNALENVRTEEVRYIADNPVLKNFSDETGETFQTLLTQEILKLAKNPLSVWGLYAGMKRNSSYEDTIDHSIENQSNQNVIKIWNNKTPDRLWKIHYTQASNDWYVAPRNWDTEDPFLQKDNNRDTMEVWGNNIRNKENNFGEFAEIDDSGDTIIQKSPWDLASENGEEKLNFV